MDKVIIQWTDSRGLISYYAGEDTFGRHTAPSFSTNIKDALPMTKKEANSIQKENTNYKHIPVK